MTRLALTDQDRSSLHVHPSSFAAQPRGSPATRPLLGRCVGSAFLLPPSVLATDRVLSERSASWIRLSRSHLSCQSPTRTIGCYGEKIRDVARGSAGPNRELLSKYVKRTLGSLLTLHWE